MSAPTQPNPSEFDAYAANYDDSLSEGLRVSGENKDFFAEGRVAWLRKCISGLGLQPQGVLDFGCGTGSSTPFLLGLNGACSVTGVEVSPKSLAIARSRHGSPRARFEILDGCQPTGQFDLAFCNGVFHHIPPAERRRAVDFCFHSLRPQGLFSFWENNPWNPGTRYVMSRITFDRDAITLSSIEARRLLRTSGFKVLRSDFLFYFPRSLRFLRWAERFLTRMPFGAQYQILCRKP